MAELLFRRTKLAIGFTFYVLTFSERCNALKLPTGNELKENGSEKQQRNICRLLQF